MNWLLILVILLIAGNIVWGYSKGFLRVAFNLVEWLLIFLVISRGTPYIMGYLEENTSIPAQITQHCKEQLQESVSQMIDPNVDIALQPQGDTLTNLGIHLPTVLVEQVLEKTGAYDRLAEEIAQLAVQGISYLLTILLAIIAFVLIGKILNLVDRIPIISGMNRLLGTVAGLTKGCVIVWLLFGLVAFGVGTAWGKFVLVYIYEAPILSWLYENNFLLTLLLTFLN